MPFIWVRSFNQKEFSPFFDKVLVLFRGEGSTRRGAVFFAAFGFDFWTPVAVGGCLLPFALGFIVGSGCCSATTPTCEFNRDIMKRPRMIPPGGFPAAATPLGFGAMDGGGALAEIEVANAYGGVGGVPVEPSIAEMSSAAA
jgi:hypothetical protein